MGLLDDAIREHLELKRRRGADAAELARLEHDAFGPIRGAERRDDAAPPQEHAGDFEEPGFAEERHGSTRLGAEVAEREAEPAPEEAAEEYRFEYVEEPEPPAPEVARERPRAEPEPEPQRPHEDPQATVAFSLEDLEAAQSGGHPGHAPDPDAPIRHGYDDDDDAVHPLKPEPGEPDLEPEPEVIPADDEPVEIDETDELEETPDFLQETPEHDRLWFEQKPPRDFDF